MDISVGVDTANDSIGVSYTGHRYPSCIYGGVARTCRTGGPGRRTWRQQDRNTDLPSDRCLPFSKQAGGSFERQPKGVSRFAS
jgi:hypothetical protein